MSSKRKSPYYFFFVALDIPIFAFLGYYIGPSVFGSEITGMMYGALLGTFIMWIHLFVAIRRSQSKKINEE